MHPKRGRERRKAARKLYQGKWALKKKSSEKEDNVLDKGGSKTEE